MQGLPFGRYPRGWFQVGWSEDFLGGVAKPLRYFGEHLVAFRGESGVLHVLDAYCPHMGAHLGFGGRVREDTIECPFHGWVWDGEGANVLIPDSDRVNRAQRIGCWPVRENCGIVLVWFDPDGGPPTWEVPSFVESVEAHYPILPHASREWTVAMQPQIEAENSVDGAHLKYVHKGVSPGKPVRVEDNGAHLHVVQEVAYGKPNGTWLTPGGAEKGFMEVELWGLGVVHTRLFAGTSDAWWSLFTTTPIDENSSSLRCTNWVARESGAGDVISDKARRRIDEEFKQLERDIPIWENMRYIERPPVTPTEAAPHKAFRNWSKQFYEPASTP